MKPNSAGRGFPVDQNLPRWACQMCRHSLWIVGADAVPDKFFSADASSRSGMHGSSILGAGSVLGSSRMDHSFVVLPKQKCPSYGIPPRPRNSLSQADTNLSGKPMEESFVVLPPAAASMYKCESGSDVCGTQQSSPSGNHSNSSPASGSGFHSSVTVLNRAFEIATTQTQVDQPLCLECMKILSNKLDKEVEDVNRDIKVYEASLQRFESESHNVLSDAEFRKEKLKVEEEEKRLEAAIQEAEKQCAAVEAELKELDLKSKNFNELQERYWHEFNSFQFQLTAHQEERDAILAKIEVSQAHLELLKQSNVLDGAFPITHEGMFGTINNFRFGRHSKILVEWDEVNAAWGQACLLLHTMCQYFRPKFHYRIKILPMGSYPRIMDTNNNSYELFGPVNLFWSTRYDKAMTLFLACLKDFGDFARSKDRENNLPPEKCFTFPRPIENDTIGTYTITQNFNKQENWTKAMKCMLCDLKWALFWFIGNTSFHPLGAMTPPPGASPANSVHSKQKPESKSSSKP